jgi:hypothetical protein
MVVIGIILGLVLWFILYLIVFKGGLHIIDNIHKGSIKKWGMDIDDYSYNRTTFKLYVRLFFIGIPLLFWIGFIIYHINGL